MNCSQVFHQEKENYELCSKLIKVIDIEAREYMNLLNTYYDLAEEDVEHVAYIKSELTRIFLRREE